MELDLLLQLVVAQFCNLSGNRHGIGDIEKKIVERGQLE